MSVGQWEKHILSNEIFAVEPNETNQLFCNDDIIFIKCIVKIDSIIRGIRYFVFCVSVCVL